MSKSRGSDKLPPTFPSNMSKQTSCGSPDSPIRNVSKHGHSHGAGPLIISFLIVILTIGVFLQVRTFGYVNYDDGDYVMSNRKVHSGITWDGIVWAFETGHAANWHPVTWLSHMLDFQLFGDNPGMQHIVSLVIHTANALLLFFLLLKCTSAMWESAFVAVIFALHPAHVESVAWLSERKDVLSGLFWLLTMFFYVRFVQEPYYAKRWTIHYCLALVSFALGLMSKPMLVTLPFVLFLFDCWPLRRMKFGDAHSRNLTTLVLEKVPFLMLAIASSVITFLVQKKGGAVASAESLSFDLRLQNAVVSYWRYFRKLLWPSDLAVLYPHPGNWPIWLVAIGCCFVVVLLGVAFWQLKRRPYLTVGFLWFVGTMVPVIGLVQVGIQSMADRYTYIPSIGLTVGLTWLVVESFSRFEFGRRMLSLLGAAAVLACIPVTYTQISYWHDSESLFRRTISVTDKNYLAWNNLGFSLPKSRSAEAMDCYRESIRINPHYADALNNYGHALAEQGDYAKAMPYYQAALQQQPNNADVNNNYGNALAELGKPTDALRYYETALKTNPNHADAHNNLGIALAMQGRFEEALYHLKRAVELDPHKASAHSNLGNAYAVQHKLSDATKEYLEALRLKSDEPQVHNNLGNVLVEQQKYIEAIEHYRLALQLNERNPEAHYNMGLALLHVRQTAEASAHFREALRWRPNYPEAQQQLKVLGQ